MFFVMLFLLMSFTVATVIITKRVTLRLMEKAQDRVLKSKELYEKLLRQKERINAEKLALSQEAMKIFMLYEITREIAKKFNEREAFEVFKSRLKEEVQYEECWFVQDSSEEYHRFLHSKIYYLFELKGKKRHFGYLAIKGLPEKAKETFTILCHQFALALRRVKLYEEIEEIAITDGLTGVHTRRYFLERFVEELQRSKKRKIDLSFLMIDVDFFKSYNDKYGHLVGDRILSEVSRIMQENIREIDIAGRFGGEEFCVVLPDTDRDGASFAAERVRTAVEETMFKAYDVDVRITVSIGIATYPQDGRTSMGLIDKADWALYRAKKLGRNRICAFGVYEQ